MHTHSEKQNGSSSGKSDTETTEYSRGFAKMVLLRGEFQIKAARQELPGNWGFAVFNESGILQSWLTEFPPPGSYPLGYQVLGVASSLVWSHESGRDAGPRWVLVFMPADSENPEPPPPPAPSLLEKRRDQAQKYFAAGHIGKCAPENSGFVVFWDEKPRGWFAELSASSASHYRPGVLAVSPDPSGGCFVATGGTDDRGALRWESITGEA